MGSDAGADEYLLDRLTPQEREELERTLGRVLDTIDDAVPTFSPAGARRFT